MSHHSEFPLGVYNNPLNVSLYNEDNNLGFVSIINDWRIWNGSADTPFSALGDGYGKFSINAPDLTCCTIKIDSTSGRWLLISEGYKDFNTNTYYPANVKVGKLVAGVQVYGDPVNLDADSITDQQNVWYRGVNVADGKVYIYYTWYNGTNQVAYAKIVNIDISDNITLGTRSAQIGAASPGDSALPRDLCLLDSTHPAHLYISSANFAIFVVSTTINNDDTITVNTPKSLGIACNIGVMTCLSNYVLLILTSDNFQDGIFSYAIPSTPTVIGNIAASLEVSSFPPVFGSLALGAINNTQAVISYDFTADGFATVSLGANIITYDANAHSLSVGTRAIIVDKTATFVASILEILPVGNDGQQVIATYVIASNATLSAKFNAMAICLTPSGTSLNLSAPIPINSNYTNANFGFQPTQSAVMSQTLIVSPYMTYNNFQNFGVTLLNQQNTQSTNVYELALFEGDGAVALSQVSTGITAGTTTPGQNTFVVSGDWRLRLLPGIRIYMYQGVPGADSYIVDNVTYEIVHLTSTITLTQNLLSNYAGADVKTDVVTQWISSVGSITLNNAGGTQKPAKGILNGKETVIFWSFNNDAYLSGNIDFPISNDCTLFIVCEKMQPGQTPSELSMIGTSAANITPLCDAITDHAEIYPSDSVGSYATSGALKLITIVRQNGASKVYVNGVLNATSSAVVLALGDPLLLIIGNNASFNLALNGAISLVNIWHGAMSDMQRNARENFIINEYTLG